MNTSYLRRAPLLLCFTLVTSGVAADQAPFALLHSFFDPGTNAQESLGQGHSAALDGNIAVLGAPGDDVGAVDSGTVKVYNSTTGALLYTLVNPRRTAGDGFGSAVAISGLRVVVGSPGDNSGGAAAGSAYVYDLAGGTPTEPVAKLTNPDRTEGDHLGFSVGISGTWVVVGAEGNDTGANNTGSALVYDLAGVAPSLPVYALTNPSPAAGDLLGHSVAISGMRVVVGAYLDDAGAYDTGSAYVYDLAGSTPTVPIVTLTNPAPFYLAYFGSAVAISGTRVVVGAYQDGEFRSGRVHVYDVSNADPTIPVATLTNNPTRVSYFGWSVAISGTLVVIGAINDDICEFFGGGAYVYDLAGTTLVPIATLCKPNPMLADRFGESVAISGSRVLVSAPSDDVGAYDTGSAFMYDVASVTPNTATAILNKPSAALSELFGTSVAISGAWVVIGAPQDDVGAYDSGSAHVYDLANTVPTVPVFTLTNPKPAEYAAFGSSVAISGTLTVVGAYQDDTGEFDAGSAYVYDLASVTPTMPAVTLTNPSPEADDRFSQSLAISNTRLLVGAHRDDTGAIDAGIAYAYDLASATPTVPVVTLTNPSPAAGDYFGYSVAISGTRAVIGAYGDDTGAFDTGCAYVYDMATGTPAVPVVTLTNPSLIVDDYFGLSVAISGTWVAVGAVHDDSRRLFGRVYVYNLASSTPAAPIFTLTNPSPAARDYFAYSMAISGTRLVVGAYGADAGARNVGRVYVYDFANAAPTVPIATLVNPSPAVDDNFGWAVAIDGTTIVAGTPFDDTNASDRGAAYIFGLQPALSIAPAAPGLATISWTPASSFGFVLQYTDSFSPTNWLNAPSGAANPVTIPITSASRFYRLFQP